MAEEIASSMITVLAMGSSPAELGFVEGRTVEFYIKEAQAVKPLLRFDPKIHDVTLSGRVVSPDSIVETPGETIEISPRMRNGEGAA